MNNSLDFKNDFKFPSITNFHSFSYEKDYLLAFRYYNIGTGKKIYYKDLVKIDINDMIKKLDKASLVIVQKQNVNNHYMYAPKSSNMKMFKCDKCELVFYSKNSLKEHSFTHIDEKELNQMSKIKLQYADMVKGLRNKITSSARELKKSNDEGLKNGKHELQKGFGFNFIQKRFSDNVKNYLHDIFEEGERKE